MQLAVAVAATVLAGMLWPGIMVLIPVVIGLVYIVSATGALRDIGLFKWTACLLSITVLVLSSFIVSAKDFSILWTEDIVDAPPMVVVSATGEVVEPDDLPENMSAQWKERHASAMARQRGVAALMVVVFLGSLAVVLMHVVAWRWLLHAQSTG